jgi:methyl-accepting chemotaxis protein
MRLSELMKGLSAVCLFALVGLAAVSAQDKQNILILHSYHTPFSWTDGVQEGINRVFDKENIEERADIYVEYMDTKRFSGSAHYNDLLNLYRDKYWDIQFDAVICSDNNAFSFIQEHRDDFLQDTPLVFSGINGYGPDIIDERDLTTGVAEVFDLESTIEIMLEMSPETERVIVINDRTSTGNFVLSQAKPVFEQFSDRLEFDIWRDKTLDEVKADVADLDENTTILMHLLNRDAAGDFYSYSYASEQISNAANRPMYSFWDFYIGHGIVGGMITSGVEQGREAAQIAVQIMNGENPGNIEVVTEGNNKWMFDFAQMERFDIPASAIPAGAEVINKDNWFTRLPASVKAMGAALVVALLVIFGFLVFNLLKNRMRMKQVQRMGEVILQASEGDLTGRAEEGRSKELRSLSRYLNTLMSNLNRLVGQLKSRVPQLDENGERLDNAVEESSAFFNTLGDHLESTKERATEQSSHVEETASVVEQLARNIESLSGSVSSQSSAINESSSAIEEMITNIRSISETAQKAKGEIDTLNDVSAKGRSRMEETSNTVQSISEKSDSLMEANKVIASIAAQTNMLAMNAAIEAAHAGGSGRGFAVVAEEIRKLAEAAGTQSKSVTENMREITKLIEEVVESTADTKNHFDGIVSTVDDVSQIVNSIHQAMEEQSAGSQQILDSIGSIRDAMQEMQQNSSEMKEGNSQIYQAVSGLREINNKTTEGVNATRQESEKVEQNLENLRELNKHNRRYIEEVAAEADKFTVDNEEDLE